MFLSVTLLSHPCVLRDLIDRFSILFLEGVKMIPSFSDYRGYFRIAFVGFFDNFRI